MGLCQRCSTEYEPKEWIYVGETLWARCPSCFACFEVGRLESEVRQRARACDPELEGQLRAQTGGVPTLHRVCKETLAKTLALFRSIGTDDDEAYVDDSGIKQRARDTPPSLRQSAPRGSGARRDSHPGASPDDTCVRAVDTLA